MNVRHGAGLMLVSAVFALGAGIALAQEEGPILLPKPKPVVKPAAPSPTLLVICDLACDWKLDGKARGRISAGNSATAPLSLGQHLVVAATLDGLDKMEKDLDIEATKQTLVRIELAPAHDARLKTLQEAKNKADQQARDKAAEEAIDKAAQEARDKAAQDTRDRADQQSRDKAMQEARDKAAHEQQEKNRPGSDTIFIKDSAEYNAYQIAITQYDPRAKAAALESFLQAFPQSVIKGVVLDLLIDTYQAIDDADKTLSAASRQLQLDPYNMKAIYISVFIKKGQCAKTSDAQTCDDAAALAYKGLIAPKPTSISAEDWKTLTARTYPVFHSAIALGLTISKKDFKGATAEYTAELMLYTDAQTQSGPGLQDTLRLAQAYAQPDALNLVKSIWFFARAWDFAPTNYKDTIEKSLEYYYKQYHGNDLNGLDEIKNQAANTIFPPGTLKIESAKTPAEISHDVILNTPNLAALNLADKEFILANGFKEDVDKLWVVMKDQVTPAPGIVLEANASVIKLAVTQDAKDAKVPDFIINMKKPLADKEIPVVGFEYRIPPAITLVGTFESYTLIPATATTISTVQILLRDGYIQAKK